MIKKIPLLFVFFFSMFVLTACAINTADKESIGTLDIRANGEDLVRKGLITKDGWALNFKHVYVTLTNIEVYQTEPPYQVDSGSDINPQNTLSLKGTHTIDLAKGNEEAEPILIGTITDAVSGHYNALSWQVVQASSGDHAGYSLVMIGTAAKDGQHLDFQIYLDKEMQYTAGEYVGDQRKGFVNEGQTGDLELTFHFDHIFGDVHLPADDPMNIEAVGFEPFAALSVERNASEILAYQLREEWPEEVYKKLDKTLLSLGHVGEGHTRVEEL